MGTASETHSVGGGQSISMESRVSRKKAPHNEFQLQLMKEKTLPPRAKAIKVKPEVKAQAEALRMHLEAQRNATQSISARRSADPHPAGPGVKRTYLPNGRLLPTTEQKSLVDELKRVQAAHRLKAEGAHSG